MDRVRDWMSDRPSLVGDDVRLEVCARELQAHGADHLVIVGRGGDLVGLLPASEVAQHGTVRENGSWMPRTLADGSLVARDLAVEASVVAPETATREALETMLWTPDRVVVVAVGRRVVGMIGAVEVARLAATLLEEGVPIGAPESEPPAVRSSDTVEAAMKRLDAEGTDHFLVVEADGSLIGVADRQVLMAHSGPHDRRKSVVEVIEPAPIVAHFGISLGASARRMLAGRVSALPIVNGAGRPVDMVTTVDLCYAILDVLLTRS